MLEVLRHGVEIVEPFLIALHPVVHLRVEMNALHTAEHALLVQPARRITVHLLCCRVVHRIVHALLQPQPSAIAFLNLIDAVVAQRGRILVIAKEIADAITVIAIQAIVCTEPHIAIGVTEDSENF